MSGAEWGGNIPRAWQLEALPLLRKSLQESDAVLLRACTGAGKSLLIAEMVARAHEKGWTCLVSVPTADLVRQMRATLSARIGESAVGCWYAAEKRPDAKVVIACNSSLLTFAQAVPSVGLWVVDEAHRLESNTGRAAVKAINARKRVGFTATPFRSDERGLSAWPSHLVYDYTVERAQSDGVLVPMRIEIPAFARDTGAAAVSMVRADSVCADWIAKQTTPGVVNAVSIADAVGFAEYLRDRGVPAEAVHSQMPARDRDAAIERLRQGEIRAIVHVRLLQEGIDLPWLHWLCMRIEVGVTARELGQSCVRFVQEAGRVLRVAPGKTEAVFYDVHGAFASWGLSPSASFHDLDARAAEMDVDDSDVSESVQQKQARDAVRLAVVRGPLLLETEHLYMHGVVVGAFAPCRRASSTYARVTAYQIKALRRLVGKNINHLTPSLRGWLTDSDVIGAIETTWQSRMVTLLLAVVAKAHTLTPGGVVPVIPQHPTNAPERQRRSHFDAWLYEERANGHLGGWAACKYRSRYGAWPPADWDPSGAAVSP